MIMSLNLISTLTKDIQDPTLSLLSETAFLIKKKAIKIPFDCRDGESSAINYSMKKCADLIFKTM